ncbi:MAG: helix-turn-helix domain-containing protein [Cyclobacteriaceae bacterium]
MSAQLIQFSPSKELSAFVKRYWIYKGSFQNADFMRILPFGAIDIIAHKNVSMEYKCGSQIKKEPLIFIEGQYLGPSFKKPAEQCEFLGITLHPWATKYLLDSPAAELTGHVVDIELINRKLKAQLCMIIDRYPLTESIGEHLDIMLTSFFSKLELSKSHKNLVKISLSSGIDLRSHWSQTSRSFQIKFKEIFGITWRQHNNKKRFLKAMDLINKPDVSYAEIAYKAGYYDQAHFIRQFKEFAGLTPGSYRKSKANTMVELTALGH